MARYINILLFTLFSFVAQSEASSWEERLDGAAAKAYDSGCEKYPDIDALDKKLLCEEYILNIISVMNDGWLDSDKKVRAQHLNNYWDISDKKCGYRVIFSNPSVKLNIASLIGQSVRNKLINVDLEEKREYALKYVFEESYMFTVDAIAALGWVGTKEDADMLFSIIKEEREGVSEHAVLAIINLNSTDLRNKLVEMESDISRRSLKDFILRKVQ
jgi:hypothetical protein